MPAVSDVEDASILESYLPAPRSRNRMRRHFRTPFPAIVASTVLPLGDGARAQMPSGGGICET